MEKRVLMVATVPSMIGQFNMDNIKMLLDMGYKIDVAGDFTGTSVWSAERIQKFRDQMKELDIACIQLDFSRSPLKLFRHISSYKETLKLIKDRNYSFIHTHTPIASAIVRLAAHKTGTKVIYTAHGFHFYKGAPLKNWLLYYPAEKICSYFTDVLITINKEDYALAQKKMKAKKTVYIPGVGIDLNKFKPVKTNSENKRRELGAPDSAVWILAVGELIHRKNHETLIRAVSGIDNVYLTIAGKGELHNYLQNLINELNISQKVKLLGFRSDISELCAAADVFAFPSFQEGLPVAVMEAMASGLPIACSRIRGNTDLIEEGKGGVMFDPKSVESTANALDRLLKSGLCAMGNYNIEKIKDFDLNKVRSEMTGIYGIDESA